MLTEAILNSELAALPQVLREATNPNATADDVRRFTRTLIESDPALFQSALVFLSRETRGFVHVSRTGAQSDDPRSWLRWPLSRLFTARRACVITNPASASRGLAVPFAAPPERYVVIGTLREGGLTPQQSVLLETLQCVTLPLAPPIAMRAPLPRFAWFGRRGQLERRLESIAVRRGWELHSAPSLAHAMLMLERDTVDVMLLEAAALHDPLLSLRTLRHAARIGDAPIVYFAPKEPVTELQALVDGWLPESASDADILKALKHSGVLLPATRTRALRARVEKIASTLHEGSSYEELAQACADAALGVGAALASVMLLDELGSIHIAHAPAGDEHLPERWPIAFMTGETVTISDARAGFFDEIFDSAEDSSHLRELHPASVAALPIRCGSQIVGTLLALSLDRPMFEPEFEALALLCERTARAFGAINLRAQPRGPWSRTALASTIIDAYQGPRSRATLLVRSTGSTTAIVLLERDDEHTASALFEELLKEQHSDLAEIVKRFETAAGILLAVVDVDQRLSYACKGVPVPLHVPVSGPVPSARPAQGIEDGIIHLDGDSLTIVYSNEFAAQIETALLVAAVQRNLRAHRLAPPKSIPELAINGGKLAFASIRTLWTEVELPRPPAFA